MYRVGQKVKVIATKEQLLNVVIVENITDTTVVIVKIGLYGLIWVKSGIYEWCIDEIYLKGNRPPIKSVE